MRAERTNLMLRPDPKRVLFRPFDPHTTERAVKIIARIMSLTDDEVEEQFAGVLREFHGRHLRLPEYLMRRFEQNKQYLITDAPLTDSRKMLIGAYFTQEYSLESAALFNPSMIWHPDQSGLPPGCRRFIISLRATGEGHISSLVFRSGTIDSSYQIQMDPVSPFVMVPDINPAKTYEKGLFHRKLIELGLIGPFVDSVLETLEDEFTFAQLQEHLKVGLRAARMRGNSYETTAEGIISLAESNYEVHFSPSLKLWERIIFPATPNEIKGIEDARFVEFTEEDGSRTYYATYTAYNGRVMIPQLLETSDFQQFRMSTLNGSEVQNKGMALFPRRISGQYCMISRQDNENMYLMCSDNVHFWYAREALIKPTFPWEYVQVGNCGSPIETEQGWLLLTHGVGPMRKYAMGAVLLARSDPSRVIGRLPYPLLSPDENEREGYVPNVVYSCGAQIFGDRLIIPYAMSDYASSFATVNIHELLEELLRHPR